MIQSLPKKVFTSKTTVLASSLHPQVLLPNTTRSVLIMIRTLNLPRTTRSKLIPLLAGKCSFQEQHERRWGALYASMMQSENILVQYMARRSVYNVPGTLGTNWVILGTCSFQEQHKRRLFLVILLFDGTAHILHLLITLQ